MANIQLSDGQRVDSDNIAKAEVYSDDLLITLKTGEPVKVHGSGVHDDVTLLENMSGGKYLVFIKPTSK
jgi:hypothetical protein